MTHLRRPGISKFQERTARLNEMEEPLGILNTRIDCEAFKPDINRVIKKVKQALNFLISR